MSNKSSIVTSAADGCGKPSSIRPMDHLPSRNHKGAEYKESFMFSNRSSVSRGCSLAAATLAAVACIGLAGTASAGVIYSDSFSGSSSAGSLNGATPTQTTNGATWTSDGTYGWADNGTITTTTSFSSSAYSGYLPFTPSSGEIYTLTAENVNITAPADPAGTTIGGNGSPWMGIAFNVGAPPTNNQILDTNSAALIEYYGLPIGIHFGGPGGNNAGQYADSDTQPQTLQIILNTSGTQWVATFLDNGGIVGSYTYGVPTSSTNPTNPAITDVSFGTYNAVGSVSSFSLTATPVPAPATLGLFAVGGLALVLIGRKRVTGRSV